MLFERIKTALILAAVFILISSQTSVLVFSILMTGSILIVAWEWAVLAGFVKFLSRFIFLSWFASIISLLYLELGLTIDIAQVNKEFSLTILLIGTFFWISSTFFLYHYPKYYRLWNDKYKISVVGLFAILPAWNGMILLKYLDPHGYLLFLAVILVASADIGAYFVGKRFGRRKLAEKISPNKTWEGVWGGAAACMLTTILLVPLINVLVPAVGKISALTSILLILVVMFFSIIGDLVESMLKRNRGIKDSGGLLPGHGGILDRIDGLIAVIPCFTIILLLITR